MDAFRIPIPDVRRTVRWLVTDAIIFLKNYYTYKQLSRITNQPMTVLNRYAKRKIIPCYEKAIELYETLKPLLAEHMRHIINSDDWSELYEPPALDILSTMIMFETLGMRVTKILAFDDLSPLAIATSLKLSVPYVIITRSRNMLYNKWMTIEIRVGDSWMYYHLPVQLLSKNDSILYIDAYMTVLREEVLEQLKKQKRITIDKKIILSNLIDKWEGKEGGVRHTW